MFVRLHARCGLCSRTGVHRHRADIFRREGLPETSSRARSERPAAAAGGLRGRGGSGRGRRGAAWDQSPWGRLRGGGSGDGATSGRGVGGAGEGCRALKEPVCWEACQEIAFVRGGSRRGAAAPAAGGRDIGGEGGGSAAGVGEPSSVGVRRRAAAARPQERVLAGAAQRSCGGGQGAARHIRRELLLDSAAFRIDSNDAWIVEPGNRCFGH